MKRFALLVALILALAGCSEEKPKPTAKAECPGNCGCNAAGTCVAGGCLKCPPCIAAKPACCQEKK